ncbi:hypothetical protein P389DRAFT_197476 [Cystobasidium minutum MCA 4210]|uniref:uncharacterized protein n=1 Tax=Cystobasidium minutum MCA 4210 TaxID=1397322 RepID=UPI0034CE2723|eukprot:jgi/Rhomi1/197476/gm1.5690_g
MSNGHVNCSEAFYKNSIVNDVRDRSDVDPAEKTKMLEMLKRIQDMGEDELGASDDDDSDEEPLTALAGLDLDKLPPEEILKHLSPEQRREFEEMLTDSTKAATLFTLNDETSTYWWLETEVEGRAVTRPTALPRSSLPRAMPTSSALGYNLVAILFAYALAMRVHGSDGDATDVQAMLLALVPFLSEKSTLVIKTISEACDYVMANAPDELITDRRKLVLLLLEDVATIAHAPKIRTMDESGQEDDKSHLALSDVHRYLGTRGDPSTRPKAKLAAQKILFYLANLDNFDRERLEHDIGRRKRALEAEEQNTAQIDKDLHDPKNIAQERLVGQASGTNGGRPKIEEIGE